MELFDRNRGRQASSFIRGLKKTLCACTTCTKKTSAHFPLCMTYAWPFLGIVMHVNLSEAQAPSHHKCRQCAARQGVGTVLGPGSRSSHLILFVVIVLEPEAFVRVALQLHDAAPELREHESRLAPLVPAASGGAQDLASKIWGFKPLGPDPRLAPLVFAASGGAHGAPSSIQICRALGRKPSFYAPCSYITKHIRRPEFSTRLGA